MIYLPFIKYSVVLMNNDSDNDNESDRVIFCDTHDNPSQIVTLKSWQLWSWHDTLKATPDSLCDPLQSMLGSTWKDPFGF